MTMPAHQTYDPGREIMKARIDEINAIATPRHGGTDRTNPIAGWIVAVGSSVVLLPGLWFLGGLAIGLVLK